MRIISRAIREVGRELSRSAERASSRNSGREKSDNNYSNSRNSSDRYSDRRTQRDSRGRNISYTQYSNPKSKVSPSAKLPNAHTPKAATHKTVTTAVPKNSRKEERETLNHSVQTSAKGTKNSESNPNKSAVNSTEKTVTNQNGTSTMQSPTLKNTHTQIIHGKDSDKNIPVQNNKTKKPVNVDAVTFNQNSKEKENYKKAVKEKIYKGLTDTKTSVITTISGEASNIIERINGKKIEIKKLKFSKIIKISDDLIKAAKVIGKVSTGISVASNLATIKNDSSYFKKDLAKINLIFGGNLPSSAATAILGKAYDNAKKSDTKWKRDIAYFLDEHSMSKVQEEGAENLSAGIKDKSLIADPQHKTIHSANKTLHRNHERNNKDIRGQAAKNLMDITDARANNINQGIKIGSLKVDTQHKNIYDTKNSPKPHERDNKNIRKQAGENANQTIKNIITNVKSAMDEKKLQHMEKVEKGYIDTQNKRFLDKPVDKDYKSRPNNRQ